jgi:hypothetical protein
VRTSATTSWTFPGNQRITNAWGMTVTQSGQSVTARPVDYSAQIPVSSAVTAGFQATYSGTNSTPSSIQCTAT